MRSETTATPWLTKKEGQTIMGSIPLKVSHQHIHARYIVFDKDGTLIDFHKIWGPRLVRGALKLKDICALGDDFQIRIGLIQRAGI